MLKNEIFELLPLKMKNAVEGLRNLHDVPDELTVPAVLQVANFAAQALTDVDPILWAPSPISLYTVILNKSAGRKSTVMNEITKGVRQYETSERRRYNEEISVYNVEHKMWEKEFCKAIKDRLTDPSITLPKEPTPIVGHKFLLEKATVNGLIDALNDVPHCGLINADAAEFFKSYSFQDKNSGRDSEMVTSLSKLFSGEPIGRQTGVKENNITIDKRRFCMLAMLQEEMADFLSNPDYRDQGFVPRLLISSVGDYKTKTVSLFDRASNNGDIREQYIGPFNDRIEAMFSDVVSASKRRKQGNALDEMRAALQAQTHLAESPCELKLPVMRIAAGEAMQILDDFYQANKTLCECPTPRYRSYLSFMGRRFEYAIRIAATLACFDGAKEITERYAAAAVGLIEWFTEQRLALDIKSNNSSPIVKVASEVADWLQRKGTVELTARELQQRGPSVYQRLARDQRSLVLDELESRGHVSIETNPVTKKVTIKTVAA